MRLTLGFAGLAVALMAVGSVPAQAAHNCQGADYVCGSSKSVSKRVYRKAAHSYNKAHGIKRSANYRTRKAKRSYSASNHSGGSYSGKASYYWQGQRVASGGWFNPNAMTAAHKTLPFGTKVRVTNQGNGKSVVVTINDRGPFIRGRIIDLSRAAAQRISMTGQGVASVSISVLGRG